MTGEDRSTVARCWAALASAGAGLIHLAVVEDHAAEWWLFGVFFAGLGAYQLAWGTAALAGRRAPLPEVTAGINLGVIALWGLTRTVGLPFGPERGSAEGVGRADLISVALEAGLLVSLFLAVPAGSPDADGAAPARTRRSALTYLAMIGLGVVVAAGATTPALAATSLGGAPHTHGGGSGHPGQQHGEPGHHPPGGVTEPHGHLAPTATPTTTGPTSPGPATSPPATPAGHGSVPHLHG